MEQLSVIWLIFLLFLLVLLSAFFSGSEIGMMSLNRYRLRHLVKKKLPKALRVNKLLKRTDRMLGTILIGNTFANIVASAIATVIAVRYMGNLGVVVATVGLTLVILIFAEIVPKTFASLHPMRVAFVVSYPLNIIQKSLAPFVWLGNYIAAAFLGWFGINVDHKRDEVLNSEELRSVVSEAGTLISSEHKSMLVSILDLEKVTVEDIMVPKNEIVGIDLDEPWDEIVEQLESNQHTRMPIYHGNIENVVGVIHSRSMLNAIMENQFNKESLLEIAEACYFIPEGTPLNMQLLNFKKAKQRTCLVVDEYGDIQGLVTLEDILEEIIGEFTTDFSTLASKPAHPQDDGSNLVDAGTPIRELNRLLSTNLPTEGPKTLSGLIIEYLEFIPSSGTSVKIKGYPIEIVQTKDNTIKTAKIFPRS